MKLEPLPPALFGAGAIGRITELAPVAYAMASADGAFNLD